MLAGRSVLHKELPMEVKPMKKVRLTFSWQDLLLQIPADSTLNEVASLVCERGQTAMSSLGMKRVETTQLPDYVVVRNAKGELELA
jgi:hypothetical protein